MSDSETQEIACPPIEHRIVEKQIPRPDDTVNIPPKATNVNIESDSEYHYITYLVPVEEPYK